MNVVHFRIGYFWIPSKYRRMILDNMREYSDFYHSNDHTFTMSHWWYVRDHAYSDNTSRKINMPVSIYFAAFDVPPPPPPPLFFVSLCAKIIIFFHSSEFYWVGHILLGIHTVPLSCVKQRLSPHGEILNLSVMLRVMKWVCKYFDSCIRGPTIYRPHFQMQIIDRKSSYLGYGKSFRKPNRNQLIGMYIYKVTMRNEIMAGDLVKEFWSMDLYWLDKTSTDVIKEYQAFSSIKCTFRPAELSQNVETEARWPPFRRQQFQMHFSMKTFEFQMTFHRNIFIRV